MRKCDELTNPVSCISRARDDEMTFVLLARDIAAPATIRAWASERIRLGKNKFDDAQIQEALACAGVMERERWTERYIKEFMRAANLTRQHAEECAHAVEYVEASDGFEDDPEGAAQEEMSYWTE